MATSAETEQALDALAARIPQLLSDHPDNSDLWRAFAKEAERIKNSVSAVDREYVTRQIDTLSIEIVMLRLGRLR
jgi:hypothetical protein